MNFISIYPEKYSLNDFSERFHDGAKNSRYKLPHVFTTCCFINRELNIDSYKL